MARNGTPSKSAPKKAAAAAGKGKAKAASKPKPKPKAKAAPKKKKVVDDDEDEEEDEDEDEDEEEDESEEEEEEEEDNDDEDEDESDEEDSRPAPPKFGKSTAAPRKKTSNRAEDALDTSLPPMTNIHSIFSDLTARFAPELAPVVEEVNRPIRVATMCSGTEAPILALGLFSRALEEQTGVKLRVKHIFSAEIEPFKQAYIERNFAPPLLFRDVTELPNEKARTAYGALVDVPGDADILIAGTSCVDYSNLNRLKKGLNDGGESSRTFYGMLQWVEKHRPPIVILENVKNAPWEGGIKAFDSIGYHATVANFDTKKYYIPHTRMRGYLVAFPRKKGEKAGQNFFSKKSERSSSGLTAEEMGEAWKERVAEAARPASAPCEAFLLDTDDPRIHRSRMELSEVRVNRDGSSRAAPDWIRCQDRHALARHQEKLGDLRPLTNWQEAGGKPTLPDGAWQDWAEAQTERVLDLMDISYLRKATEGVDITYKSAIWNLSQNVDRTTTSKLYGITPCLTPNMIPYLTSRGGPVVGAEALALQGLPIDELLLTRENTDQLADLAGNAMSSTVVGTAIAAALIIAGQSLIDRKYDDEEDAAMEDSKTVTDAELEGRFRGSERLEDHPVDLASVKPTPADLLQRALRSARKCVCEGREHVSKREIVKCTSCGHSSCRAHAGKPEHKYVADPSPRDAPAQFAANLVEYLPMRLTIPGFDRKSLEDAVKPASERGAKFDDELLLQFIDAVEGSIDGAEFHFRHVDRRETWAAVYASKKAKLELHFEETGLEWRLFAIPPADLPTLDKTRRQLEHPVARIKLAADATEILKGEWQLKLPITGNAATLDFDFDGEFVPSWRAGLELVDFVDEKRPSQIKVKLGGDTKLLDRSIDGTYVLETKCGTATNNLYRRTEPAEATPLFFFFDPSPWMQEHHDSFVFAESCNRMVGSRDVLASLPSKWRPPTKEEKVDLAKRSAVDIPSIWTALKGSSIAAGGINVGEASSFATIKTGFELAVSPKQCSHAEELLIAKVPLAEAPSSIWARENWHEVDLQHEGPEVFSKLAWMVSRIPDWENLGDWQGVEKASIPKHTCQQCAPDMPEATWIRQLHLRGQEGKKQSWAIKVAAREDGLQSAAYENLLKDRPSPLLVHTRQRGKEFEFRIGLNIVTLAHRALAQLPSTVGSLHKRKKPTIEWRLTTSSNVELGKDLSREFTLKSNRDDPEAKNPGRFKKFELRKEQLRSLHWMIEQEKNPKPWVEEEVAEALLPQLGWHAEVKAQREVVVRGGVVADAVGYGKTAITLGLLAARHKADADFEEEDDRVAVKGTLVVVPGHLIKQWAGEVKKFTQPALEVLTISTMTDLKKKTIENFQDADLIVCSESVFKSANFWPHLADFAASPLDCKTDKKAGRYFRHSVDEALKALGVQVARLREEGAKAVDEQISLTRENRNDHLEQEDVIPDRKKANKKAKKDKEEEDLKDVKPRKLPPKPTSFGRAKNEQVNDKDWKLDSKEVRKDWTQMKCPPLAMFSFARVIVDEFSYTEGAALVGVHSCRGRARWILSGTPPLDDFSHIKFIADMLHINIGCDDDNEGTHVAVKTRIEERTAAEKFRSYCDVRTKAWHARRDDVAQKFLDHFARQNVAEIDEIPFDTELIGVRLPGAEMAIYRELEHHLRAVDPNLAKIAKIKMEQQGDRDKRLREALGRSATPDEALLKRCSHFSLDLPEDKLKGGEAPDVCKFIGGLRKQELEKCTQQLKEDIATLAYMHRKAVSDGYYAARPNDQRSFQNWVDELKTGFGDKEADEMIRGLARVSGIEDGKILASSHVSFKTTRGRVNEFIKPRVTSGKRKQEEDEWIAEHTLKIRVLTGELRTLAKELMGRLRSLRYFKAVRKVIVSTEADANDGHAILSCCGHEGPVDKVLALANSGKCIDKSCRAQVQMHNVLCGADLGSDRTSGHFGYKLETLITLIKQTPKDDKVLVFVQFEDLYHKVHEALSVYGIATATITGTAAQKSKVLDQFQNPNAKTKHKVMLLLATDSSSSGANLTIANHAFFVSPLLTDTKSKYKALATQATGRIVRYGQSKTAHIYHLLVHGTLDMKTYGERNDLGESCKNEKEYSDALADIIAAQPNKRDEVVNPRRKKTDEWQPIKPSAKSQNATNKAAKKAKKAADEAAAIRRDPRFAEEVGDAEDDEKYIKDLGKVKGAEGAEAGSDDDAANESEEEVKPKKVAAKSKGKGKRPPKELDADMIVDSDEEPEAVASEDESDVVVLSDDESDDEPFPEDDKNRGDDDDYSLDLTEDSPPRREVRPRRSATHAAGKLAEKEDSDDDEAENGSPTPTSPAKSKKRRHNVIEDDEDEDDDEEAEQDSDDEPVASTSKAKSQPAAKDKGKGKAQAPASPVKSKSKSVFEGVIIESPPKKKQKKLPSAQSSKPSSSAAGPSKPKPVSSSQTAAGPSKPASSSQAASTATKQQTLGSFFKKPKAAPAPASAPAPAAPASQSSSRSSVQPTTAEGTPAETPATEADRQLGAAAEKMEVDEEEEIEGGEVVGG
ncbi:hypothetical protein JCM8097_006743 [Rhodosporidiobolus ruineniae]